jgi:hypothetical protein
MPNRTDRRRGPTGDTNDGDSGAFDLAWIGRSLGTGERRQVVVLAVGFPVVGISDPEELAELQARRRRFVLAVASRFAGSVGRVDPELQLVAWGWPTAGESDTRLAVAAALELAAEADHGACCGIDAGIAITAGSEVGFAGLGFVGEMVAASIALRTAARPGEVVVSPAVANLLADGFELAPCDERHPPARWRVVPDAAFTGGAIVKREQPAELIGRQDQQKALLGHFSASLSGEALAVAMVGEAGVGKSALLGWLDHHARSHAATFVRVACLPELRHKPLEPIRKLLELFGDTLPAAATESSPAFAVIADRLLPRIARSARECPLVLAIEDAHWAAAATLELLASLPSSFEPRLSLLIVVTHRPDAAIDAQLGPGRGWHRMPLPKLTRADLERIIASRQHAPKLRPQLVCRIADRCDGNPFYALELSQLCARFADEEAHHRLLARPNRLNSALTSRLDALAGLKPLAQAAAILGRQFDSRVLAAVLAMSERALVERLDLLVRTGLLVRRRKKEPYNYRFNDALLWSQAYGSLLKARRRDLHAQIAQFLESDAAIQLDPDAALIAHHWRKGGNPGRSFKWWFKAALEAAEAGASANAVAFVNRALNAKDEAPAVCSAHDEATLMSVLGAQLRVLNGSASRETVAAYERALNVVNKIESKPVGLDFDIAWGITTLNLVRGDINAATEASSRLVNEATERGRDDLMLVALRTHGTARLMAGLVSEAIRIFSDAVARYDHDRHGDLLNRFASDPGAVAYAHLASAQALALDRTGFTQSRNTALALAGARAHPHTSANVLGVLVIAAVNLGDRALAGALARGCGNVAARHDYKYWLVRSQMIEAWCRADSDPQEALRHVREAIANYRSTGAARAAVFSACLAAEIAIRAGHADEAIELLAPVRDAGPRQGDWLYMPEVQRLEALARAELGQWTPDAALAEIAKAEAMSEDHGSRAFTPRFAATRSRIADMARPRRGSRSPGPALPDLARAAPTSREAATIEPPTD